jgi:hypothetical protein
VAGDAAPTTTAVNATPPLPHDSEPKAPAYHQGYTPPPPSSPSPKPTHRQSPEASPTHKPHHHGN